MATQHSETGSEKGAEGRTAPTVMLLHGIGRTARSMAKLEAAIAAAGYATWPCTYPSRRADIETLAEEVRERLDTEVGEGPVAAVTHSMGGILLRHLAVRRPIERCVMLAPPNRGSAVARFLSDNPLYRRLYGPSGQALACDRDWPPPPTPCGVIAGDRALSVSNPTSWFTRLLGVFSEGDGRRASDGTVAVEETRVEGMTDFAVVPANHTWIMNHPVVIQMVLRFLASGSFAEAGEDLSAA